MLNQAKYCGTLHVYAIVCGMTVQTDSGPVYPNWSFGDRIRKARITTGMTQEEFAAAIKVKEGTLAAWETNRAHPRSADIVDVAKRIEALTNIPTSWLLGIDDGPPPQPPSHPFRQGGATVRRRLRPVPAVDVAVVNDDAMAYVRMAEGQLPQDDSKPATLRLTADYATDCATGDCDATLPHSGGRARAWWLPSLAPVYKAA
jgi:transcriptional regulator with XRE-family HTH domain